MTIDSGNTIDWGKTSNDYSLYRSKMPDSFFRKLLEHGIGKEKQKILDLGSGTGNLAREFSRNGSIVSGIDISEEQILVAQKLMHEQDLDIDFQVSSAESLPFNDDSFDCATANQCFLYFDTNKALAEIKRVLKPNGLLMLSHFSWLPRIDAVARESEKLVLKYNPNWGAADYDGVPAPYINDSAYVGICIFNIGVQQDGQNLNSFELSINIGKTPILIVDDDGGGLTDKFYTTILDSMYVPYSLWDRMNGPLSYEMVQNSPILIWFTEWSFPTLDFEDREVIMEYLDNGGNLYLSGQDLGWELNEYPGDSSQTAFFYNYLHADWGGDDAGVSSVQGVPGNPISDGLNFNIYQPGYDGGSQYPDYFSPHDDANSIFTYSNGLNMGLSYTGDYRLVYTGTGLETFGSNSSSTAPNDINESQTVFLDRTLNYLNFINHTPLVDNEDSTSNIYFHVSIFNDGADFNGPFLYYRLNGGEFNMVEMHDTTEGFYYTAPSPNQSVLVEYYFSVHNSYYNWTNPINTDEVFQFSIGRDMIAPDVNDLVRLPNFIDRSGTASVSVLATDNIGIDSVFLYWYYSFNQEEILVTPMSLDGYFWQGNIEWENLSGNDKVYYFATAKDSSSNSNIGYSDTLSFQIINKTILTQWDEENIGQWDTGQNWGLSYVNSAVKYGMNDSPSMNYENNKSDYLTLLEPFDLSDYNSAYLQFWTGSFLRENDIGTIQISGDGSIWESIYSISGINFVDTVKIEVTEYIDSGVYLRFHISTDASGVASGWYVDDIHLLVDTSLVILSNNDEKNIPINFHLSQNFPNPFNPTTSITFSTPIKQMVRIEVFDLQGRLINIIYEGIAQPGEHTVRWEANDYDHNAIPTGIYFYRLTAENYFKTRKMLYLK